MFHLLFGAVLLLLAIASYCDWKSREIPDWIAVSIVGVAIAAAALRVGNVRWWMVLSGGAMGLVLAYAAFRFGRFGGGDAKLIAALGALLGPVGLPVTLMWVAIAGGLLAICAWVGRRRDFAFVPAIAIGYVIFLACSGWKFGP